MKHLGCHGVDVKYDSHPGLKSVDSSFCVMFDPQIEGLVMDEPLAAHEWRLRWSPALLLQVPQSPKSLCRQLD
jgi:hypothetical protein